MIPPTKKPRAAPRRLRRPPGRRRRPPALARVPRWAFLLVMLLVPIAFWLGQQTAPAEHTVASVPFETESPPDDVLIPPVSTSTAGLCPCPVPKKPRPRVRPIDRKKSDKVDTTPFERPDPTKATAAYLRDEVKRLSVCAPSGGSRQRVHLEVTVLPTGAIEAVKVTNLEPLPPNVSTCVEREMKALTPPGFDATTPVTFGLTAVL